MTTDWRRVLFQRLLNLPEPKMKLEEESLSAPEAANPWAEAAAGPPGVARRPVSTATDVPWRISDDSHTAHTWRRIARTSVLVLLVLFAWIGVRTAFMSGQDRPQVSTSAAVRFDTTAASGTAARFVMSAMTWDEDSPKVHSQAVGLDYPGGGDLGWNGKGRQNVATVLPEGVAVASDGKHAIVTVLVQLEVYTRAAPGEAWTLVSSGWSTVEVPVAVSHGRMVATGAPAPVGQTAPTWPANLTPPPGDGDLSKATQEGARAFFVAYGAGDVSAVEAPGATITAPTDRWEFSELSGWQVDTGAGQSRTATATVIWQDPDTPDTPVTYTVTYAVTLVQVTGGGGDRWQVSAITTGSTANLH